MSSGGQDPKKRKISDLRFSIPFCSQSALEAICKEIAKHGLPDKHSRFDVWKETKQFLEGESMSMYGPLLKTMTCTTLQGTQQPVLYLNFLSLVSGAFNKGGAFTDFLLQFHATKPSCVTQPWQACVYCDEMHPGNMLNSSSRKAWCCYLGFLEMGTLLSRSDIWFCLCVVRTSEVAKLQAGMSQVLRLILEDLFGHGLPETGVLLTSHKGSLRLYFSLSMILQDGSAHKQIFANRQDAGSKPCFICSNIFYLRSGEEEHCKIFKEFIKYDKLHISTDQDVLDSWQRLAAKSKTLSQADFKMHQQAAGLTYNEHALLSSETLKECGLLKPISLYCFDYMHGMCSSGLLGDITYLVLESIHNAGIKIWQDLQPWLEVWVLPKAYSCCLGNLFDSKSVSSCRKAHTFKCSASEMLSLYKLLGYYLQVMFLAHNIQAEQCRCFLCWANVLDYLVSIPFIEASPSHLLSLVERALESSVQAGFGDEMKPKQHWSIHYADCLKRWSQLPACWALERKHKTARRYGSNHCRLGTYEQGLLASVTMEHISILVGDADLFKTTSHLIGPRDLPKKLEATLNSMHCFVPGMLCSNSAMLQSGSICKANDVVFLERLPGATSYIWSCGQAKHFLAAFELQFCLVEVFTFLTQREGTMSSSWATSNSLQLVPLGKLLQPVAHTFGKDGKVLCLTPAPLACQM